MKILYWNQTLCYFKECLFLSTSPIIIIIYNGMYNATYIQNNLFTLSLNILLPEGTQ